MADVAQTDAQKAYDTLKLRIWHKDLVGKHDAAQEFRDQFLSQYCDNPEYADDCANYQVQTGDYYKNKGLLERAIEEYTKVYDYWPDRHQAAMGLWQRAFCALHLRRFDDAKQCLQRIFDQYYPGGEMEEAVKLYGDVLVAQGSWDEALAYWSAIADDAARSDRLRAIALTQAGYATFRKGNDAGAMLCWERCIRECPVYSADASFARCVMLAMRGDVLAAEQVRGDLAGQSPVSALIAAGYADFRTSGLAQTISRLLEAVELGRATGAPTGQAFYELYTAQVTAGDLQGADATRLEWARTAPLTFREHFPMSDSEFGALAGHQRAAANVVVARGPRLLSERDMAAVRGGEILFHRKCTGTSNCGTSCSGPDDEGRYTKVDPVDHPVCEYSSNWWDTCVNWKRAVCGHLNEYGDAGCTLLVQPIEDECEWGC